jgi:hypothetical protein
MKSLTPKNSLLTLGSAALALLVFEIRAQACTAFEFSAGNQHYVAKNHDFVMGEGLLIVNHRGLAKKSVMTAQPIEWVSRYGSVTYNQFGREMPNAGMNEAGLVVEMLWLNETKYASPDARMEIGVLQWIQFQLDTAQTVADVIASDQILRIADGPGRCHFFITDREGHVAIVEILNGRLEVHTGADLPIPALANDIYASCVDTLQAGPPDAATAQQIAATLPSFNRFQSVAGQVRKFDGSRSTPADFAFGALQRVRHPRYTQWQVVYDTGKPRLMIRRQHDDVTREIDFAACDFRPTAPVMAADLTQPGALEWVVCTTELNRAVIAKSYHATPFLQHIGEAELNSIAVFPEAFQPVATSQLTD